MGTIVYKKLKFTGLFQEEDGNENIRMINRCAAINRWKDGVNGLRRVVSITNLEYAVEIWYEV